MLKKQSNKAQGEDPFGNTPLMMAAASGYLDIVKLLVEKGADLEAVGITCVPAIVKSAFENQVEIVKYLITKGVNLSGRVGINRNQSTYLDFIIEEKGLNDSAKLIKECLQKKR